MNDKMEQAWLDFKRKANIPDHSLPDEDGTSYPLYEIFVAGYEANKTKLFKNEPEPISKEYRIVPRKFGYRDKVRLYQSEGTFRAEARGHDPKSVRFEVRDVTKWKEITDVRGISHQP